MSEQLTIAALNRELDLAEERIKKLEEAESAAKEYYPSDRHFMAGVQWLFTRLLEMSEGEFDEKAADIDSEGYEHDVYTADPDGVASHPAKHWVDGRRWQHALSQAALLKAREEIARLKSKDDIEIAPGVFEVRDPENIGAFLQKRIDALAGEGITLLRELNAERARCERMESVLKTIEYTNRSRGYPTGGEWQELIRLTKQALSGEAE